MPLLPPLALADDLTGAAEIAALGHRFGWKSEVITRWSGSDATALLVIDTDSRLQPAMKAARTVADAGLRLAGIEAPLVYKKTDSVLRGPVYAELRALMDALRKSRVLLVPANPGLGRVIRDGHYYVNGTPLHETAFARDPHHPARTSDIAAVLGGSGVQVCRPDEPLPGTGIIIGAAASGDDVIAWARRVDDSTLPAGGGEFFSALLRVRGLTGPERPEVWTPDRPVLVVRGSLASRSDFPDTHWLPPAVIDGDAGALDPWIRDVLTGLTSTGRAAVACQPSSHPQAPARVREAFARLARSAVEAQAVRHLMIEGGATAATLLAALGWTRLEVAREWAQGVVTLRPAINRSLGVTMKPGSYAWPDAIRQENPWMTRG